LVDDFGLKPRQIVVLNDVVYNEFGVRLEIVIKLHLLIKEVIAYIILIKIESLAMKSIMLHQHKIYTTHDK